MAYQAKRVPVYTQEFELVETDGTVVHSMKVEIDPGAMVEKLSRQHIELVKAQKEAIEISKNIDNPNVLLNAYEKLGSAVISIIKSVFGEVQTDIILDFYNHRYNDIIQEVAPFIIEVVIPEVRRISQENRKNTLQKYNRKTKRAVKRGMKWDI